MGKTKLTIRHLYHDTYRKPNRWPLSNLNLIKNMKTYIRRQQHKKFKHQDKKQKEPPQKYRQVINLKTIPVSVLHLCTYRNGKCFDTTDWYILNLLLECAFSRKSAQGSLKKHKILHFILFTPDVVSKTGDNLPIYGNLIFVGCSCFELPKTDTVHDSEIVSV